jgi:hypothetical protein
VIVPVVFSLIEGLRDRGRRVTPPVATIVDPAGAAHPPG